MTLKTAAELMSLPEMIHRSPFFHLSCTSSIASLLCEFSLKRRQETKAFSNSNPALACCIKHEFLNGETVSSYQRNCLAILKDTALITAAAESLKLENTRKFDEGKTQTCQKTSVNETLSMLDDLPLEAWEKSLKKIRFARNSGDQLLSLYVDIINHRLRGICKHT